MAMATEWALVSRADTVMIDGIALLMAIVFMQFHRSAVKRARKAAIGTLWSLEKI